ncbi:MAG: protein kinase [Bacteroidota bacterium]|jgi:non-specific serine/threonine protein kinase
MIGSTISHYKILEKIGEGGMGVVYRAHDTKLDRDVALKFLPHYLTSDPTEKERFNHEARAAAALTHSNIAVVHEIGEHEGQIFIAMEYVEGQTLRDLVGAIHESPLPVKKILDIAIQVCEGLAAAHEKGIVHRDIKSDNIIVTRKGQAKITDFGLAKLRGATKLTKTGSTLGTAAYMSPEQAQGEDVDHRSDIFSFGVVLYELLTGKLPFRGEHQAALMYSIMNEDPQPVARFNEKVTPEIEHIVTKTLAKDKEERYQHADDLLADLRHERKKLEYAKAGYATATIPPAAAAPVPKRPSRVIVPGAVAVVLIAVLCIYLFYPRSTPAPGKGKSIAVLPFKNISDNKEDEFFSDGLTEDIITQLSKIQDMDKVIARTSVMQYKGANKSIREIGKELDVATVLEGSVRRAGSKLRVVAQLIDASNEGHLWAETYDREMTDVFAIQSDVAQQIAAALKVKLTQNEKSRIEHQPTKSITAYEYYLKGREYYYQYTDDGRYNAIKMFNEALQIDSNYALAYAGLSDTYGYLGNLDTTFLLSSKAIALDPQLPEAHKAKGNAFGWHGRIHKAIEEYQKAIELNPNYSIATTALGNDLRYLGEVAEAYKWHKKAIQLEPTRGFLYSNPAYDFLNLLMDEKAEYYFRKAAEITPDFLGSYEGLRQLYLQQRRFDRVIAITDTILQRSPKDTGLVYENYFYMDSVRKALKYYEQTEGRDTMTPPTLLCYCYWKLGMKEQADEMLSRLEKWATSQLKEGNESVDIPIGLAWCAALRDQKDEAFRWLEKANEGAGFQYYRMMTYPHWKNLQNDERFPKILGQMKAKIDEQRKLVEEMEKAENQ